MRVTLRPTVAADLPHCIGESLPFRIKCITGLVGDRVIGLGGLGFKPDGTVIAFAQLLPEARGYPAAIHRGGLMVMDMIRASRAPLVIAEAQPGLAPAERWLLRLGFEPAEISGQRAFVWRRPVDAHD